MLKKLVNNYTSQFVNCVKFCFLTAVNKSSQTTKMSDDCGGGGGDSGCCGTDSGGGGNDCSAGVTDSSGGCTDSNTTTDFGTSTGSSDFGNGIHTSPFGLHNTSFGMHPTGLSNTDDSMFSNSQGRIINPRILSPEDRRLRRNIALCIFLPFFAFFMFLFIKIWTIWVGPNLPTSETFDKFNPPVNG